MDQVDKLKQLQGLSEAVLRREVLIPLLSRMSFRGVGEYHGSREHGKDIVCFEIDKLGQKRHLGIVVKTTDLTGSVSSSQGLMEVLRQAEQCFNEPYYDLFGMHTLTMDQVWIVTTGHVVPGAGASVMGKLQKTNLEKLTRIVAGQQLIELLDEHYPTYWNSATESTEQVRSQRDRVLSFLRKVLRTFGATSEEEAALVNTLLHSAWGPRIETISGLRGSVVRATSYSVTLSTTPSRYVRGLVSKVCGDLNRALRAAQDEIRTPVYELEDVAEKAEKALALADPREFVEAFDKIFKEGDPFPNKHFSNFGYLSEGLDDIDSFLERLKTAGRIDEYYQLVSSLDGLEIELAEYLPHVDTPQFSLAWEILHENGRDEVVCRYSHTLDPGISGFSTSHTLEVPTYKQWGPETRPITASDVIESAQFSFREYFERQLPAERA